MNNHMNSYLTIHRSMMYIPSTSSHCWNQKPNFRWMFFHNSFYIMVVWLYLKDVSIKVLVIYHSKTEPSEKKKHNAGPHFNHWLGRLIVFRVTTPDPPSGSSSSWGCWLSETGHTYCFLLLLLLTLSTIYPSCLVKCTCINAVRLRCVMSHVWCRVSNQLVPPWHTK